MTICPSTCDFATYRMQASSSWTGQQLVNKLNKTETYFKHIVNIRVVRKRMCGSRNFVRGGPNNTKSGPSSAHKWNANIECWLGSFVIFQGISIAIKSYILWFFRGVGGGGSGSALEVVRHCFLAGSAVLKLCRFSLILNDLFLPDKLKYMYHAVCAENTLPHPTLGILQLYPILKT